MRRNQTLLVLTAALATVGCTTLEKQIEAGGGLRPVDRQYIATAYEVVQVDDAAGKLAAARAKDPRVQDLSQQIQAQANTLEPDLRAALKVEGVTPPAQPPAQAAQQLNRLRGLTGPAFDREYLADELALHQRAVTVFQQEDTSTRDGPLRFQVEAELPALRDNLAKLKGLSDAVQSSQG